MKEGAIIKNTNSCPTEEELLLINSYTRRSFSESEVYVFSVVLCDNDIDRDYERFTVEALFELEKLFVGKTGIFDHSPKAKNQTARIFECHVEAVEGRKTLSGDDYFRLVARAYMPRTKSTEDMIMQIESGICKEVSVGCAASHSVCSVCGNDKSQSPCGHKKGAAYGDKLCYYELGGITDAYEWSFVAVPAQREAGVIKSFYDDKGKDNITMKEIIKSLDTGDAVTLCTSEAKRLYEYIRELEDEADLYKQYRQELCHEVVRLACIAQPEISKKAMEKAFGSLSVSELKEFHKVYEEKAEKKYFPMPQLMKNDGSDKGFQNKEFKI